MDYQNNNLSFKKKAVIAEMRSQGYMPLRQIAEKWGASINTVKTMDRSRDLPQFILRADIRMRFAPMDMCMPKLCESQRRVWVSKPGKRALPVADRTHDEGWFRANTMRWPGPL